MMLFRVPGDEREEVIGRHVCQVLNWWCIRKLGEGKTRRMLRGQIVQYEMRYEYPVRGEGDLLISYFPIEGEHGIDRVACVLQDMTDA